MATSNGVPRVLPDHAGLFVNGYAEKGSPQWRDDDKDGHYMFALGDNLTSRCNAFSHHQRAVLNFLFLLDILMLLAQYSNIC